MKTKKARLKKKPNLSSKVVFKKVKRKITSRIKRKFLKQKPVKIITSLASVLGLFILAGFVFSGSLILTPSIDTDVLSISTSSTAPSAPSGLKATVNNSTVTLTWLDKSTVKADKYIVYRYDDLSGDYVTAPVNQIISAYSRKYVSNQNEAGKTYQFKVAGVRVISRGAAAATEIQSELSESVSVVIPVASVPKAPTNLRALVKNSVVSLSWRGEADGFVVEKYDSSTKKYIALTKQGGIVTNTFSDRQFEPGKSYKFRVSAFNNVIKGGVVTGRVPNIDSSSLVVRLPKVASPQAPTGIKTAKKAGVASISWKNPSTFKFNGAVTTVQNGVDGYEIMAQSGASKQWVALDKTEYKNTSGQSILLTSQKSGQTNLYKIRAYIFSYAEASKQTKKVYSIYSNIISVSIP